jgi:hypothetical protein
MPKRLTKLQILTAAREKLQKGWCRFTRGQDIWGMNWEGWNPSSVRWCAIGSIDAVLGWRADKHSVIKDLVKHLSKTHYVPRHIPAAERLSYFNDTSNKEDVLALFDLTIESLSKKKKVKK